MLNTVVVSDQAAELLESSCPFCQEQFSSGDQVVQCPSCQCWHHVFCWRENEDHCAAFGCAGQGQVSSLVLEQLPSETVIVEDGTTAMSDVDELIGRESELIDAITITSIDPETIHPSWVDIADLEGDAQALEMITVDKWEIALNKAVKTTRLDKLLSRIGVKAFLERRVKGEHYFRVLGIIVVIGLTLMAVLIIALVVRLGAW